MTNSHSNRILGTINAESFIGRENELDELRKHARRTYDSCGLLLLSAPAIGASELLKQTFDALFNEPEAIIPFYFAVRQSDRTAKECARRFLQTFVRQTIAYHHQNASIIDFLPTLDNLVTSENADRIKLLTDLTKPENQPSDERTFIGYCLNAPLFAAAGDRRFLMMVDHLHEADFFSDDFNFIDELKAAFSRSKIPFVLAGSRRFVLEKAHAGDTKLTDAIVVNLAALEPSKNGNLLENLAAEYAVETNDQTRDLIVQQFRGNLAFNKFLMQAAHENATNLNAFRQVEQVYTDELFGGRIGKFYDSLLNKIAPAFDTQKEIVKLFNESLITEEKRLPVEIWIERLGANTPASYRLISLLHAHEIVRLSANQVEPMAANQVLCDYFAARFRLEIAVENRAQVVGEAMSDFLKRAPQTMAKYYRQNSAVNVRDLLTSFNNQEIPLSLLDYSIYKADSNGAETSINEESKAANAQTLRLPQIVYTAHTETFYPPFAKLLEKTRSTVALGFAERAYTDADETVWIAAEIDSKLEAAPDKAAFWCDRLEMVALTGGFPNYKIWLIAPEGFSPEALEILKQRGAFGSSRRQVMLLAETLKVEAAPGEKTSANEYEIVMPMGENTELIAVTAVEEIARFHHFESKAINQIKTALVEACINATEHSLSPDRKIHQKITVAADKLVITISNRGLRLTDRKVEESTSPGGRRGWGLKLMRTLMDEVIFEQVDDGTRISMTKYLR